MQETKKINHSIVAILLAVAFLFPSVVQFAHAFADHEHITCEEQQTHIHQDEIDCDLCHFHQGACCYDINAYPDLSECLVNTKAEAKYISLHHFFSQTNTRLRAPPVFS